MDGLGIKASHAAKGVPPKIRNLQVVLKLAERCNIACTYCYYFFAGDESYKDRPPLIATRTIEELAEFLAEGVLALEIPRVIISFHGGEPMMLKRRLFDRYCATLRERISPVAELKLTIQTNGTLIDEEWLELFSRHDVEVGVSIDGPAEVHDKHRIDHRGRPTSGATLNGIKLLSARPGGADVVKVPPVIAVVHASNDYGSVYRYFRDQLGLINMSFLLPDLNHDTGIHGGFTAEDYGRVLIEIFDQWTRDEAGIYVRQIDSFMKYFQLRTFLGRTTDQVMPIASETRVRSYEYKIIVVQADGRLAINDSYMTALGWQQQLPKVHVKDTTLADYLGLNLFEEIDELVSSVPTACESCMWRNVCRGGELENRYSRRNGFDNPSVYCDGLKLFYSHVVRWLYRNGYPKDHLERALEYGQVIDGSASPST